jgi:hypothetical protein
MAGMSKMQGAVFEKKLAKVLVARSNAVGEK